MVPTKGHRVLVRDVLGKSGGADRIHLRAECHADGVAVYQTHAGAYHRLGVVERLPGKAQAWPQAVLVRRKHSAPWMTGGTEVHDAAARRRQVRVGNAEIEIGDIVVTLIKPTEEVPADAVRQRKAIIDAPGVLHI